ncbi:uncharacterized protein LOC109712111 [Ananas comosus]|uniref:Uncharacterized protein LOC109712111 n=1 Tax=Ananas comosus TaxID=4615 RepID=A0A6P5F567_ANACO|nr:uncharacterized protein LOC109712111 [Ananas comosus]
MKLLMTYNENIKTFNDISRHLELEAECLEVNCSVALVAHSEKRELIHSDICGPMNVRARHGACYFLKFIDDYFRYGYGYLLSRRSEALDCFKHFVAKAENQIERSVKALRTDRGREYLSDQFKTYCEQKGINRQLTIPDTPQQNSVAKRRNHSDMTKIESRDVEFLEGEFPSIGEMRKDVGLYELQDDSTPSTIEGDRSLPEVAEESGSDPPASGSAFLNESIPLEVGSSDPPLCRSERGHIPRRHFEIEGDIFICSSLDNDESVSYKEALQTSACSEWMTVMKDEMNSMSKNQVWELVDLLPGRKSIRNK